MLLMSEHNCLQNTSHFASSVDVIIMAGPTMHAPSNFCSPPSKSINGDIFKPRYVCASDSSIAMVSAGLALDVSNLVDQSQ